MGKSRKHLDGLRIRRPHVCRRHDAQVSAAGCEKAQRGKKQLQAGEADEGNQEVNAVRGGDFLCQLVYHRDILLGIGEKEGARERCRRPLPLARPEGISLML